MNSKNHTTSFNFKWFCLVLALAGPASADPQVDVRNWLSDVKDIAAHLPVNPLVTRLSSSHFQGGRNQTVDFLVLEKQNEARICVVGFQGQDVIQPPSEAKTCRIVAQDESTSYFRLDEKYRFSPEIASTINGLYLTALDTILKLTQISALPLTHIEVKQKTALLTGVGMQLQAIRPIIVDGKLIRFESRFLLTAVFKQDNQYSRCFSALVLTKGVNEANAQPKENMPLLTCTPPQQLLLVP